MGAFKYLCKVDMTPLYKLAAPGVVPAPSVRFWQAPK